jgi:signal transduction histidine kinase
MTLKAKFATGQKIWKTIAQPRPISLEYRQWRDRLIRQRFWLAIGLAVTYMSIQGLADFYEVFINPEQLLRSLEFNKLTNKLEVIHQNFILHKVTFIGLLGLLILLWKSGWGRKHPALMLMLLPWAIAFIPEIVLGAFFGIPRGPSTIMFMAQVVIVPIYWRLHLLAQIVPIAFYFLIYPLIGLASFGGRSIYSFSYTVEIILVCIICEVGVYLYEQSKQSELEANRRLQLCIHSITHDLRTPVMGSLMLLQSILESTPMDRPIHISQTEMAQLIRGSDRLLGLMNSLLAPQALSQVDFVLHRQPTHLSAIVTTILQDLNSSLIQQNVQIDNRISADLPLVEVDARQIGRVFENLISNAIAHNPSGISIALDAVSIKMKKRSMLKAIVRDNGVVIAPAQQETIFEPYTRGQQTQYQPGLGLGLYICRQVVRSHGGEIGIENLTQGKYFWFTLPLSIYSS